jgi:hypothetical protein
MESKTAHTIQKPNLRSTNFTKPPPPLSPEIYTHENPFKQSLLYSTSSIDLPIFLAYSFPPPTLQHVWQ